jgi:hypothetical protein
MISKLVSALSIFCVAFSAFAATNQIPLPAKDKLDLYLLMGQSNMAGRGKIGAEDKTPNPRVIMLETNDAWVVAIDPVTKDRKSGLGVGPGLSFGKTMAEKNPSVTIGLVPCAVGGTPLKRWQKGGDLYERAVRRAKFARQNGMLKGVLWHQGESDTGAKTNADTYGARLAQMISDLRADLDAPNLPVVVGELGPFVINRTKDNLPLAKFVDDALKNISNNVPLTACASSEGLKDGGDALHFDAASQREFGRRYAAEMLRLQGRLAK